MADPWRQSGVLGHRRPRDWQVRVARLAGRIDNRTFARITSACRTLPICSIPFALVRSIAAQLATHPYLYRAALEAVDLVSERDVDPGTLMRRLIADPLRAEAVNEPIVIVIDALDESLGYPGRNIAKLVAERLSDLPPSVRLIVSSRKDPRYWIYSVVTILVQSTPPMRIIFATLRHLWN